MGDSKTINLLLNMTEPIDRTGMVNTGNSGVCVVMGVMALQKFGMHGQFLIKKRKYWPKHVPGDYINGYMPETFVQEMEAQQFFVHCTKDCDYITKIMSMHGVLDEIQDHATWRLMDGVWRTFKCAKPFSRHNRAKHWVDDVNNRCHDPTGLEDVWAMKWWPNRQFTFLLSVAEVNAVQNRTHAKKETAMLTLEFCKKMAMLMMTNKLNDNGVAAVSPVCTRARTLSEHGIVN